MNPHRLTWSYAYDFNFAAIIAVVTLLSVIVNKDQRQPLPLNSLTIALIMFFAWTGVTTIFAFQPADAFQKWTEFTKTIVMAFLIPLVIYRKDDLRVLIWVTLLSVAYYGFKGGIFTLFTGGGHRVWGPESSYISDNNALAAALVMIIPMLRYLQLSSRQNTVRWALAGIMVACGISAIGSHSRGALLAIGAMVVFFCWKTKRKLQVMLVLALAVPVVLSMMPEHWYQRMDTISNYEQDSSALMRLNAWGTAVNVANDRPLVGGGFEMVSGWLYRVYAPDPSWPPQVAHSIYFQALGEHGYVGLLLYIWLYYTFWRYAKAVTHATRRRPDLDWAYHFGLMTQVTLVAFATGGAFLSLIPFDVPYYLLMIMVVMRRLVTEELQKPGPEIVTAPPWQAYGTLTVPHSTGPTKG
jgi:probable O-glycosylation ligase (exosortase A-associated)